MYLVLYAITNVTASLPDLRGGKDKVLKLNTF